MSEIVITMFFPKPIYLCEQSLSAYAPIKNEKWGVIGAEPCFILPLGIIH